MDRMMIWAFLQRYIVRVLPRESAYVCICVYIYIHIYVYIYMYIYVALPCPPPGDLPDPGIKPVSPVAPELQVDSLPLSHW